MSGFLGWMVDRESPPDSVLLGGGLPPGALRQFADLPAGNGAIWTESREPIAAVVDQGLWGVVDGRPIWRDTFVARVAGERGDAAALLAAYRGSGVDFVRSVRGSFALAIVDSAARHVFLAVDRFGTRPLAYGVLRSGGVVFGSSVEAIRRHPDVTANADPQAVYSYFFFHMIPSPLTIYSDLRKLQPAEYVFRSPAGSRVVCYWQPNTSVEEPRPSVANLQSALRDKLKGAVDGCEPGPNTGAYLSGGLDSSTVAGFLSKAVAQRVRAYCVGFDQPGYDEMGYARIAADHFGLKLREIYATPTDVAEIFDAVALIYDEPFGNSSAVPALLCARHAAEDDVTQLLAGDGGDELFGGNERYVKQSLFDLYWRLPQWGRRTVLEPLLARTSAGDGIAIVRKMRSYVRQASMPMPDRTQSYNLLHQIGAQRIFEPEFLRVVDPQHPFELLRERFAQAPGDSLLTKTLYLDWKFTLADNDLRKVTRTAQHADVVVSYPMLNDELVELSVQIPDAEKIVRGELRKFYKDALREFLPEAILEKKKHGFGLPFGEWLKHSPELRDPINDALSDLRDMKIIRAGFIDELMRRHASEHAAYFGGAIWVFAMFSRWARSHQFTL